MARSAFDSALRAEALPRETLVMLWRRTASAHGDLSETWHAAVAERRGTSTADAIALEGWPLRGGGATPLQLFYDDVRFVVAATALKPDLLTVAKGMREATPKELLAGKAWSGAGALASRLLPAPRDGGRPSWVGAPNKARARVRGRGVELGFALLLKLWQRSRGEDALRFDTDAFEARVASELDRKALALLWNYAALAYMLGTDRWYTGVRKRFGDVEAQVLEKEVWIDRGAAERDLAIGLDATGEEGRTVETLLQGFQLSPGEVGILDVDFELKDESYGILTHRTCPALDRFEHYDEDRRKHCCEICIRGMPLSGKMVSSQIECTPLKLPPRLDSNDIACQWQYTLRGTRSTPPST